MHWPRLELGSPAWQASILPLDHQCLLCINSVIFLNFIRKLATQKATMQQGIDPECACKDCAIKSPNEVIIGTGTVLCKEGYETGVHYWDFLAKQCGWHSFCGVSARDPGDEHEAKHGRKKKKRKDIQLLVCLFVRSFDFINFFLLLLLQTLLETLRAGTQLPGGATARECSRGFTQAPTWGPTRSSWKVSALACASTATRVSSGTCATGLCKERSSRGPCTAT